MITTKEQMYNTYIKNDNGLLLKAYIDKAIELNILESSYARPCYAYRNITYISCVHVFINQPLQVGKHCDREVTLEDFKECDIEGQLQGENQMTDKDITFCVKREGLTNDQIKTLHGWCLEAGAEEVESAIDWRDGHEKFIGVVEDNFTFSYTGISSFGFTCKLLKFSEVREFLGLSQKLPQEYIEATEDSHTTSTEAPQQDFGAIPDDCIDKNEIISQAHLQGASGEQGFYLRPKDFLFDIVKPSIKEFSIEVTITMSKESLVYTIFHPLFDKEFKVTSEEDYEEVIKGFATLSKFYK